VRPPKLLKLRPLEALSLDRPLKPRLLLDFERDLDLDFDLETDVSRMVAFSMPVMSSSAVMPSALT